MAPFRPSRSTRSGRPGGPTDQDVFDGLPVRQWRLRDSAFASSTEANSAANNNNTASNSNTNNSNNPNASSSSNATNKQEKTASGTQTDPPNSKMPKGSDSYKPYCIQILKAARAGKFLKGHQTTVNVYTAPTLENDNNKSQDKPQVEAARGSKRSAQPSLVISKWTQVPKNLEEPELEYLAKRRKGLIRALPPKTVTWAPPVDTSHMRKTKVLKEDEGGQTQILEVMVPEGKTVQGEIKEAVPAETVAPTVAVTAPGTVIQGLGVANEQGVVVATEGVIPLRKKPVPPPRKKKKPRGRKKITSSAGTGVSASVDAIQPPTSQPPTSDPSSVAQVDTPMTGTRDTGTEDEEQDDEGSEEEEEEDGAGGEEGDQENEASDTPEAQAVSQKLESATPAAPSPQTDTKPETQPTEAESNVPTHVPAHIDEPDELPDAPPAPQSEATEAALSAPSQEVEMEEEPINTVQQINNQAPEPSTEEPSKDTMEKPKQSPLQTPTQPSIAKPESDSSDSLSPVPEDVPEPSESAAAPESSEQPTPQPVVASIETPVSTKEEETTDQDQEQEQEQEPNRADARVKQESTPAKLKDVSSSSSSPSPPRPSPEPLSPLSQPSASPTISQTRAQRVREVDSRRREPKPEHAEQRNNHDQAPTSAPSQSAAAQNTAGGASESANMNGQAPPTEQRKTSSTRIPPEGP